MEELYEIHNHYTNSVESGSETPIILKVTLPGESNLFEHMHAENYFFEEYKIKLLTFFPTKLTFNQIRLDESTGKLFYKDREISVVYLRTGYNDEHFTKEGSEMLQFLELTEKSRAICIPTVKMQLLGMKILQKFLIMDEFIHEIGLKVTDVQQMRKNTTEILSINQDFGMDKQKLLDFASLHPKKYQYYTFII